MAYVNFPRWHKDCYIVNWRVELKGGNEMKRLFTKAVVIIIFGSLFLHISCATIFRGTHSSVDFSSDPAGAQVYVNGFYMGDTPIKLKLESKRTYNIEFKKEGYRTKTFTVTNHVGAGWVVLDVVLGLVPVIVDAATGSWYSLDQEHVNAMLEKQQEAIAIVQ